MPTFKEIYHKLLDEKSPYRKAFGVLLIIIGFLALITPFTPGSWLIFVGLEALGIRIAAWQKVKSYLFKNDESNPIQSKDK